LPYRYIGTSRRRNLVPRLLPAKLYKLAKLSPKGYARINIGGDVHFAHRLVALAWVPNPQNLPQVNHKNGNKTDNHPENLQWVSNQQNRDHAVATGLQPRGSRISKRLFESEVTIIRTMASDGVPQSKIAREFGVCQQTISHIVRGSTWKHV
jgi:hypothetical protein